MTTVHNPSKGVLLLVDDIPTNLKALLTYLHGLNFEVRVATHGEEALQQLVHSKPDLILLDVLMPKIDGFETCRRLKINPETRDIPVIFMTALDDNINKVKGFEMGGVDYITKPIHHEEVLVRITTHLNLKRLQKELEQKNRDLQQKNERLLSVAQTIAYNLQHSLAHQMNTIDQLSDILANEYLVKLAEVEPIAISQLIKKANYQMLGTVDKLSALLEISDLK